MTVNQISNDNREIPNLDLIVRVFELGPAEVEWVKRNAPRPEPMDPPPAFLGPPTRPPSPEKNRE